MLKTSSSLGEVDIRHTPDGLEPVILQGFTTIGEYSEFKFGDGGVGDKYGRALGSLMLQERDAMFAEDEVYVASSAFRVAPPASESLLGPFIDEAQAIGNSAGASTFFRRFRVHKKRMATTDYAGMTLEERSTALEHDLALPDDIDLKGKRVIMLDDIRVTGLREAALERLLGNAGVEHTSFYYVLNVPHGTKFPQTEAVINIRAVKTIDDVLVLANRPNFIPNVRVCKFILSQSVQEIERFCATAPQEVVDTVLRYIRADDLEAVVKAIP